MLSQHNGPPWHPLYCSLKVNRARQHLRELQDLSEAFGELHPYDVVTGNEPEWQTVDAAQFPLVTFRHGPPDIIAGCLGDCLQAYKSALDHAIYHLTVLYRGKNHPGLDKIEFPIIATRSEYIRKGKKWVSALPMEMQAFIEELQPYLGRTYTERQSLFALWELARLDRHRYIHVMSQAVMGPGTMSINSVTNESEAPAKLPGGSSLFVRYTANIAPGVQMNATTPLSIVVKEPTIGIFPLQEGLIDIDLVVRAILAKLASGDYWG
jgi:hypothetical protein